MGTCTQPTRAGVQRGSIVDRATRSAGARAAVAAVAAAAWATAGPGHAPGRRRDACSCISCRAAARRPCRSPWRRRIAASPAAQAPLPIAIGPAGALPKNSFVRVRGLPPTVSLSEGYVTAPGAWSVPIYALSSLQMIVPVGVAGRADLIISLVGGGRRAAGPGEGRPRHRASAAAAAPPKEAKAELRPSC